MKLGSLLTSENERERVVIRTSLLGIAANVLLAAFKALLGLLAHSFAMVIDAINNLSDALSSLITIVGTKLAGRKADSQHPLGHGRIEYFTTLLVAMLILYAGLTALVESVKKIIHPENADYSLVTILVLVAAVIVKILLGTYVKKKGQEVHSDALKASGADALFDAVLSLSVLVSALIFLATKINLEAFVGVLISFFIIKSGFEMLKETVGELIGKRIPRETVEAVRSSMMKEPEVQGVYDVILHSYGPDRYVGSAHIAVSDSLTAGELDEIERRLADRVYREQGIAMTGIGVYAVNTAEPVVNLRNQVTRLLMLQEGVLQVHGFAVDTEKKIIRFDVVLDFALEDRQKSFEEICGKVQAAFPDYTICPVMDLDV